MLSAVENHHLGPGRPYFAGPALQHLVPPSPIPTGLTNSAMSAAEFVRPHPKIKCNGAPPSLSPTRSKYVSEQNGPVNLAVGPSTSPNHSVPSPSNSISPKDDRSPLLDGGQPSPKEAFSPSRLPYPTSPAALTGAASMYQQALNYGLYSRGYPLYPPPHPLAAARSLQRPFLSGQLEPYPTFIPAVPPFTTPGQPGGLTAPPQLPPLPPTSSLCPPTSMTMTMTNQNGLKGHNNHPHGGAHHPHGMDTSRMTPNNVMSQQQQQHPMHLHKTSNEQSGRVKDKSPNHVVNHNNNLNHASLHHHLQQLQQHNHNLNNNNNMIGGNGGMDSLGFKVPSGKEGSLKHRILTRPYDKDAKQRSPTSNTNGGSISFARAMNNNNTATQNFTKGSLIELANGEIKRVEEMRTEDFILSAEKSSELELADSTVVKLTPSSNNNQIVFITFSYDNNRSKVDIDVIIEHPFFVYGKGWSSFNPDGTQQKFGLKCQQLQVGDICISLKPRNGGTIDKSEKLRTQSEPKPAYQPYREFEYPQNLSRRPHTVSTTATGTTVTSRPAPPVDAPTHLMSTIPYPNHILELQRSANFHSGGGGSGGNGPTNGNIPQIIEPTAHHNNISERRPLSHETPSLQERYSAALMGMMMPTNGGGGGNNSPCNNDQPISMVVNKHLINDEAAAAAAALEAEASRKRRWSAPDNFDDEMERRALIHGKYSH